jgi:uncharacterized protein YjbI with pentapeptide repeats
MSTADPSPPVGPRFSIRGVLVVTTMLALLLAWRRSYQDSQRHMAALHQRIRYLQEGQHWSDVRAKLAESRPDRRSAGTLANMDLQGANLRGVTLQGRNHAYERTQFQRADLEASKFTGGVAAFSGARFDDALLMDATLTGGTSSFQMASFAGADLTGAKLVGGPASFQGSTFQNSKLVNAKIVCNGASFQAVNLDGADLRGADLAVLNPNSLRSCHFGTPPLYDATTRFPPQFDPAAEGWKLADSPRERD